MCGVLGSSNLTPNVTRVLPFVALAMEDRGHHAWGASDGNDIIRHLGPIHETWASESQRFTGWQQGIWHTRHASTGASGSIDNIHPFRYERVDGTPVIGIHNGCLYNHDELNRVHQRTASCDSMHLWMHRAAGLDWGDIRGWANVAWFEHGSDAQQHIYLARLNSDALNVAQLEDGGIIFASTASSIRLAAGMTGVAIQRFWQIDEGIVYKLTPEALYETEQRVSFGQSLAVVGAATSNVPVASSYSGNPAWWEAGDGDASDDTPPYTHVASCSPRGRRDVSTCHRCYVRLQRPAHLLCNDCIDAYYMEWMRESVRDAGPVETDILTVLSSDDGGEEELEAMYAG